MDAPEGTHKQFDSAAEISIHTQFFFIFLAFLERQQKEKINKCFCVAIPQLDDQHEA